MAGDIVKEKAVVAVRGNNCFSIVRTTEYPEKYIFSMITNVKSYTFSRIRLIYA